MQTSPPPKKNVSTTLLVTVGILRDPTLRRKAMLWIISGAILFLFAGATFFMEWLKEHPLLFIAYWLACAWLTITAALLAIYDLLMLRKEGINEKRRLNASLKNELYSDVLQQPKEK